MSFAHDNPLFVLSYHKQTSVQFCRVCHIHNTICLLAGNTVTAVGGLWQLSSCCSCGQIGSQAWLLQPC